MAWFTMHFHNHVGDKIKTKTTKLGGGGQREQHHNLDK